MKLSFIIALSFFTMIPSWGKTYLTAGNGAIPFPDIPTIFSIPVGKQGSLNLIVENLKPGEEALAFETKWSYPEKLVRTNHKSTWLLTITPKQGFVNEFLQAQFYIHKQLHSSTTELGRINASVPKPNN